MQRRASLRAVACSANDSPFEHRRSNDDELASVVKGSLRSHGDDAGRRERLPAATEDVGRRASGPPAVFSSGRNGGEISTHPSQVPSSPNVEDQPAERSATVPRLRETRLLTTAPRNFPSGLRRDGSRQGTRIRSWHSKEDRERPRGGPAARVGEGIGGAGVTGLLGQLADAAAARDALGSGRLVVVPVEWSIRTSVRGSPCLPVVSACGSPVAPSLRPARLPKGHITSGQH